MYDRVEQWNAFSDQVLEHIKQYTLVQYGSPDGDEQVESFTADDCRQNMFRYLNRFRSNARGNIERLRDLIKIAHYAQFAYDKLKQELQMEDVYHESVL